MHFGEIEIPADVVTAQRKGALVVFAGAGVSSPSPSGLPNFADLVKELGDRAGAQPEDKEPPENFLGRLARNQFPVVSEVERIIGDPRSQPSMLHRAILGLFPGVGDVRVVTTNFDRHFSTAARETWGGAVPEFSAPALPPGDVFRGIVHVHGRIGDSPPSLVITDEDFGVAYLIRGFARRFLVELFQRNTVLFVGYSHDDTVLTYLSRGLPFGTPTRYALTRESSVQRWRALQIEPILYPTTPEHEEPIVDAFAGWGRYVSMGLGDHDEEIRTIVALGPGALDPQSRDYLRSRIEDPNTVSLFTRSAEDPAWLEWAAAEPVFARLFSDVSDSDEVSFTLGDWFARTFASRYTVHALGVVARSGGKLSSTCWSSLALSFHRERPDSATLAKWIPVLLANVPPRHDDYLELILQGSRAGEDDRSALAIFEFLTTPRAKLSIVPSVLADDQSDRVLCDLEVPGDDYWLNESVHKVFQPRIEAFGRRLLAIGSHQLERAFEMTVLVDPSDRGWDWISIRRPALERNGEEEGASRQWWDAVIDAVRIAIDWAVSAEPALARRYCDIWAAASAPILRRFAIRTVHLAPWYDAGQRLEWLLGTGFFVSASLRHEVYELLRQNFAAASDDTRRAFLGEITSAIDSETGAPAERTRTQRNAFDFLHLLAELTPGDREIDDRLRAVADIHPEWAHVPADAPASWREHSDDGISKFAPQDVAAGRPDDPGFVQALLSQLAMKAEPEQTTSWYDSPDRALLETVAAVAAEQHEWALALSRSLSALNEWKTQLWDAIIDGLSRASLDDQAWFEVVIVLSEHLDIRAHVRSVARLLEHGGQQGLRHAPPEVAAQADEVAMKAWNALDGEEPEERDDWLETAINHPAGQLAVYFVQTSADPGGGLLSPRYPLFESWVTGSSYPDKLGSVVLASQLHYLHARNRPWSLEKVIPALNWFVDPLRARQMWDGFLSWSRLNPALVDDLTVPYASAFENLGKLGRLRDRFTEHLAVATLIRTPNPMSDDWLPLFLQRADEEDISSWTRNMAYQLRGLREEQRLRAWGEWIARYWELRNRQVPRPITKDEARGLVDWAVCLPEVFDDAVVLATAGPVAGSSTLFYTEIGKIQPRTSGGSLARLIAHVLKGEFRPYWHCPDACRLANDLADDPTIAAELIAAIAEELIRLQCPCGPDLQTRQSTKTGGESP